MKISAASLRSSWARFSRLPGGRWLFSRLLGIGIPYSGSTHPYVEEIRPGYARIRIRDRRAVRNHLESVHAIALMNVAELTTGLAMTFGAPDDSRSILTGLAIDFTKKARGSITAEAEAPLLTSSEKREVTVPATLKDAAGNVVATASARWLVGPRS